MRYPRPLPCALICPLTCLLQIDPKVAFPRRAQPKVGVQICVYVGGVGVGKALYPGQFWMLVFPAFTSVAHEPETSGVFLEGAGVRR